MLEMLRIWNFRSIEDSGPISFSKLNILVGCNNSGKSSILAVPLLLKQTLLDKDPSTALVTSGPLVDLGSYLDIVRTEPETKPFQVEFRLTRSERFPFSEFKGKSDEKDQEVFMPDQWKLSFLFDADANEVRVKAFELTDTGSGKEIKGTQSGKSWSLEGIPEEIRPHLIVDFMHFIPWFRPFGPKPDEKLASKVTNFSFSLHMRTSILSWQFERLAYVGPIRERIPRYGVLGTMPYSELTPSGQNLMRVLSSSGGKGRRQLLGKLNFWLDKKFQMLRDVRIVNLDRGGLVRTLVAKDRAGRQKINLAATGTGISQIVPVVVQTLLGPKDGCLIVEQPEIHLHPAAQTTLADLFLDSLQDQRQYIVETHSEHFVLRVRRRVAEGKAKPEDVRIFFVEKPGDHTTLRMLDLTPTGQFNEWPEHFFDEGYKEALALAEAEQRR
jgi:hypothetical protein